MDEGTPLFPGDDGLIRESDLPALPPPRPDLSRTVDVEIMAYAFVCSEIEGWRTAVKKYGVTEKELRDCYIAFAVEPYKNRRFVARVNAVRDQTTAAFAKMAAHTQASIVSYMSRAAAEADTGDPDVIAAMGKNLEIVTDVLVTMKIIDARLTNSEQSGTPDSRD